MPRDAAETRREIAAGLKRGALIGLVISALALPTIHLARTHASAKPAASVAAASEPATRGVPRFADFGDVDPPADVRRIADWATDSRDNGKLDFVVLDKREAHVYVFDPDGRLRAHTPVLLGAAAGDDTVEGVGQKPLHQVRPEERTTPAGRFIGESGRNADGEDVFWVDYAAAVSMHRVRQIEPSERRLERLASPTPADNRISYGCINMPTDFYDTVMVPTFRGKRGMVYVLPEVRSFDEVFPATYDVAARYRSSLLHASAR
ncbi:hypothetical protein [Piscinibacter sakaiensis]|uniref:hypothetical protein n=1 Tax=Piscinibacter sakaiensis TaxID=1547922 RepID=UPI003AAE3F7A